MSEENFDDTQLLANFEKKLQVIRDRTRGVAKHYHTGVYLVGRPGTSKTYTVEEELGKLDIPYIIRNARMTPMGLFELLLDHPDYVIVLDDITTLFKQDAAMQILMAALGGKPGEPRTVTYKSKDRDLKFEFTGGIIAISNVPLRHDPLANALASRVVQFEHNPTDDEIAAFMRLLALREYKGLSPEKCREVVDFVIEETRNYDKRLDLRHQKKAYEDRRQWENGHAKTAWKDLVRTSLQKMLLSPARPLSKTEDIEEQMQKVEEAILRFPDDTQKQIEFTGLKKSTFYSRRRELKAG